MEEFRRTFADLAARSKFTEPGKDIEETRTYLSELIQEVEPESPETLEAKNAAKLAAMADFGWVEMG